DVRRMDRVPGIEGAGRPTGALPLCRDHELSARSAELEDSRRTLGPRFQAVDRQIRGPTRGHADLPGTFPESGPGLDTPAGVRDLLGAGDAIRRMADPDLRHPSTTLHRDRVGASQSRC